MAERSGLAWSGLSLLALVLLPVTGALADAIDGNWCWESRHLQIEGPTIVTPAGKKTTGDYTRHAFSYVVPAPEPNAGQTISMTLISENIMHLRIGEAAGREPQIWRRCAAPST
jgi:hypothetical protein